MLAEAAPLGLPTLLLVGAFAGVAAAAAMAVPMSRQPEGFTPAYVAAGVVGRRGSDAVSFRDAAVVHHAAGALTGVLYALVFAAVDWAAPDLFSVGGVGAVPHALAVTAVVLFIYAFFAHLVLPRAGGRIYEEQATAVRGQWLRSSLVFGAVMVVVIPMVTAPL